MALTEVRLSTHRDETVTMFIVGRLKAKPSGYLNGGKTKENQRQNLEKVPQETRDSLFKFPKCKNIYFKTHEF